MNYGKKERPMSKQAVTLCIALAVIGLAGTAQAVAASWTGGAAGDWHVGTNWDTTVIPGVGVTVGKDVSFALITDPSAGMDTVDLKGTGVDLGRLYVDGVASWKYRTLEIQSTTGPATFNCSDIEVDNYGNLRTTADVDLVVTGDITGLDRASYGNGGFIFGGRLTAAGVKSGAVTFDGLTTINGAAGLEVHYTSATRKPADYTFNNTLATSNISIMAPSGKSSTMTAGHVDTLAGVTGAVTVGANGTLALSAVQNTWPAGGISVAATGGLDLQVAQSTFPAGGISFGALSVVKGDATGVTWGTDLKIVEDTILALSAGEPTAGDIGGSIALKGVLTDGTFAAGAAGTNPYKAFAMGAFTTGDFGGKTLRATAGSGDLELQWRSGAPSGKNANGFNLETADASHVANIDAYTTVYMKGGTINQTPTADAVTVFNFVDKDGSKLATLSNGFTIQETQTFNFSGPSYTTIDSSNTKGHVTFSDQAALQASSTPIVGKATNPNTHLTFNDGAGMELWNSGVGYLEQLDFDTQITINGAPMLGFSRNGYPTLGGTNLRKFMSQSNISFQSSNTGNEGLPDEGLILGDGKYLMAAGGITLEPDTDTAGIASLDAAVGGEGTTMGLAGVGGSLKLKLPIDAKGATVLINSTNEMTAFKMEGGRVTAIPTGTVYLYGAPIKNAKEVVCQNGTLRFMNHDIDDSNPLTVRIEGPAMLSFDHDTLAETVPFDMSDSDIIVDAGGAISIENSYAETVIVRALTLNADYGDNSGISMNSDVCKIVVESRFSGDGGWGEKGTIEAEGTVAPGNGAGTLTGGDLDLADGTSYEWQIANATGDAGTDWDLISADTITFDGTWTLKALDIGSVGSGVDGNSYAVASVTDALTGFDLLNVTFEGDFSDGTLEIIEDTIDGGWDLVLSGLTGGRLMGDANGDGFVDDNDLSLLLANWATDTDWAHGEFSGEAPVDDNDLSLLLANWTGSEPAGMTVPEPASLAFLTLGGLGLLRRRRK